MIVDTKVTNDILEQIKHPQRKVVYCEEQHRDYGHTCRHNFYSMFNGDYVWYLDDDDYVADENALHDLEIVTEDWAIFPVFHYAWDFEQNVWSYDHWNSLFSDPPCLGKTGTSSFIVKREYAQWPMNSAYDADGVFVETLLATHPYQSLTGMRPLLIIPSSRVGKTDEEMVLMGYDETFRGLVVVDE